MNISHAPNVSTVNFHSTQSNRDDGSADNKQDPALKSLNALSSADRQILSSLQQRDSEVRSHEAAHIAAGGSAVRGGASFEYEKGPDGKLYAVGGEVPISVGEGATPEQKLANAKAVRAGALAPASPSPQDLKVAANAAQLEAQARFEIAQERSEALKLRAKEVYGSNDDSSNETYVQTSSHAI